MGSAAAFDEKNAVSCSSLQVAVHMSLAQNSVRKGSVMGCARVVELVAYRTAV